MNKRRGFAPLPYGGSNAGNIKLAGWTRATKEDQAQEDDQEDEVGWNLNNRHLTPDKGAIEPITDEDLAYPEPEEWVKRLQAFSDKRGLDVTPEELQEMLDQRAEDEAHAEKYERMCREALAAHEATGKPLPYVHIREMLGGAPDNPDLSDFSTTIDGVRYEHGSGERYVDDRAEERVKVYPSFTQAECPQYWLVLAMIRRSLIQDWEKH